MKSTKILLALLVALFIIPHATGSVSAAVLVGLDGTEAGGAFMNYGGYERCSPFYGRDNGTITSVSTYSTSPMQIDLGIFNDLASYPTTVISALTVNTTVTGGWETFAFSGPTITQGNLYWLCAYHYGNGAYGTFSTDGNPPLGIPWVYYVTATGLQSPYPGAASNYGGNIMFSYMGNVGPTPTPTPLPTPLPTATPIPTPTPTPGGPTPTPTPIIYDASIKLADGQFNWADSVFSYNPLLWANPDNALGFPDRVYAILSGTGYPNFFVQFPRILPFPYSYGNLKALRLVIVGGNYANLVIRPAINNAPVCTAQTVTATGYSYHTFTVALCPQLRAEYMYQDGAQGSQLSYYIGSYSNGGSIDAIGYQPIFDNSPSWVATASAIGDTAQTLEVCRDVDIFCKMRNWFSSNITYWFGVNTQYAYDSYQQLINTAYSKSPWAYINAIANVVYTTPTYPTPGIVPDFTIGALNMPTYSGPSNSVVTMHQYLPAATVSGTQYSQYYNAIMAIRAGIFGIITFAFLFAVYQIVKLL